MSDFTFKQIDKIKRLILILKMGRHHAFRVMKNIKNFAKALEEKKLAENKDQNNKITTKWEPL